MDLRRASYMDSTGIRVLESMNAVHMTVLVAPGTLSKLLEIAGANHRFTVQEEDSSGI